MSSKIKNKNKNKRITPRKARNPKQRLAAPAPKPRKNVDKPRRGAKIKGRGGYLGDIGHKLGSSVGGFLGGAAGNLLGSIFGSGSYTVDSNSLVGPAVNGPPSFLAEKDGSMIVAHREFISDITSSTGFILTSLNINPGQSSTFPWLSRIAANFEEYEMLGLVFEYKTTSATAVSSTNTALGVVVMATDYNVDATLFTNKQQMEAYQFSCSTSPAASVIHPVECAPGENVLKNMYVRTGAVPTGEDARFYDLGLFQIATVGMQAASTIGELWVSYHVKLRKPKLLSASDTALSAHASGVINGDGTIASMNNVTGSTLHTTYTVGSYCGVTFPSTGNYLVTAYMEGTGFTSPGAPTVSGSGNSGLPLFNGSTSGSAGGTNQVYLGIAVKITNLAGSVAFSVPGTTITGAKVIDLFITPLATSQLTTKSQFVNRMRALLSELLHEEHKESHNSEDEDDSFASPPPPSTGWFSSQAMVATGRAITARTSSSSAAAGAR